MREVFSGPSKQWQRLGIKHLLAWEALTAR
jgi:hypothetical protein